MVSGGRNVDIWFARRNAGAAGEEMERHLSPEERARAARFATATLRADYAFAHDFLRRVLARYLGCEPAAVEIVVDARGKPEVAGRRLCFSLSHSGAAVAVAVTADGAVGVDVEQVREVPDWEAIAACYFPAGERDGDFLRNWTRMEARAKASGRGLGSEPDISCWAENLEAPEGLVAAVAMERGPARIRYQKL